MYFGVDSSVGRVVIVAGAVVVVVVVGVGVTVIETNAAPIQVPPMNFSAGHEACAADGAV